MYKPVDILRLASAPLEEVPMELVYQKNKHIPGSIKYDILRFRADASYSTEDTGMLIYHYHEETSARNYLELKFCTSGNRFCYERNCGSCNELPTENCSGKVQTVDLYTFHFSSSFLNQFTNNVKLSNRKDEVIAFKHPNSFTKFFPLCTRKRNVLDSFLNHSYTGSLENIFINAKIHEVFLYSLKFLVD